MPMLRRLMELGCSLVEYEKIVDDRGRRLVFFGRHAGFAGMLDTLAALGRRLSWEGIDSPFSSIRHAHEYADLEEAHAALAAWPLGFGARASREAASARLRVHGIGQLVQGRSGDLRPPPFEEVLPEDLETLFVNDDLPRNLVYKVVFARRDRVARTVDGAFDADELREHPDRFRSAMTPHLALLTVLVNCIYWEPGQPRVLGLDDVSVLYGDGEAPRLRVIGDISCDLHGSIESTVRVTTPDDPVYVYDVLSGQAVTASPDAGP
jgi:alpha-aminoadipic semialdehyde synthase